MLPDAPPNIITRVAHGYHDVDLIRADVEAAGMVVDSIDTVDMSGVASSAHTAAITLPRGSPLRAELESYGPDARTKVEAAARGLLEDEFGSGPVHTPMRAYLVTASSGN